MSGPAVTQTPMDRSPGFFGKLPGQGDFISRRLPADFIRGWDAWLQAGLHDSRRVLGEDWFGLYLISPIWRFVLAPGTVNDTGWAGLLMPSVDRVGRYFPLTVACALPSWISPSGVFTEGNGWFEQAQTAMLNALQDTWLAEQLETTLVELGGVPCGTASEGPPASAAVDELRACRYGLARLSQLQQGLPAMIDRPCNRLIHGHSVWWSEGSERLRPSLLALSGLPKPATFSALCSGRWADFGWIDLGDAEEPDQSVKTSQSDLSAMFGVPADSSEGPCVPAEPSATARQGSDHPPARSDRGPPPRVLSAARTHTGKVRHINQDAFLEAPQNSLWAVADGMGGHAAGDHASRLVVDRLGALQALNSSEDAVQQIEQALNAANAQLLSDAEAKGAEIIGTTVVILSLVGWTAVIAWVGDSRLYRLRAGQLQQLTTDHTEVQEWVAQGRLSAEEAERHPHGNVLARAVGAEEQLEVAHRVETLQAGDRYLLCSDGLSKELSDQRLLEILSAKEAVSAGADRMIAEALAAGGRDNVTVVIAEVLA